MATPSRGRGALLCGVATAAATAATAAALACNDPGVPVAVDSPTGLDVAALDMHDVRVAWQPVESRDVSGYRLERRANLTGAFTPLGETVPQSFPGPIVYVDADVEPDTYYGYRLVALARLGGESPPSVVRGAKTPPPPGIEVSASTHQVGGRPGAIDPDGYLVVVSGDGVRESRQLAPDGKVVFSPLAAGTYQVVVEGVSSNCDILKVQSDSGMGAGAAEHTLEVTDQGVNTRSHLDVTFSCRDPALGRLVARVTATGDSLDTGYDVTLSGVVPSGDTAAAYVSVQRIASSSGSWRFDDLQPGDYELRLEDVAPQCALDGEAVRQLTIKALGSDTVSYQVTCHASEADTTGYRYKLRQQWSPREAPAGARVSLNLTLDLTAEPARDVANAQGQFSFNTAVLRYDSARAGQLNDVFQVGTSQLSAGFVSWTAVKVDQGVTGSALLGQFHFTVIGQPGQASRARGSIEAITGFDYDEFGDSVVVIDEPFTVSGSGAGGSNQTPHAEANGPYAGTAGVAISFSAAGSFDPDGAITGYAWAFGDGQTGTGQTPGHTYTQAGDYTATLTVTDDSGATATDQAQVTVTGGAIPDTVTWRNTWAPDPALPGSQASLRVEVDLRSNPGLAIGSVGAVLKVDTAVVRLDSVGKGQMEKPTFQVLGDSVIWSAFTTTTPWPSGNVHVATFHYTVRGAAGSVSPTTSTVLLVGDTLGVGSIPQSPVVVEDTLHVGAPANQPPHAEANGPYGGTAGAPITFSSAGSSDPDGSISGYAWNFGDGTANGSGASPTHTFAGAGTYTVTLTVTDDHGATGTDQAVVTVAESGGNVAPTAEANGPYTGTTGSGIVFSSTGSMDPDGSISSYSWTFGDGANGSGASPTHAYANAGTYTVTLRVTDNRGATGTDQAQVTVSAPTQDFAWTNAFGGMSAGDSVTLSVQLNLSTNISDTPGEEQLGTFYVDSLKWDPTVLTFGRIIPTNSSISYDDSKKAQGKLAFGGNRGNPNTGVMLLCQIRFLVVGGTGSHTTTVTKLGLLRGTSATGNFNYLPRTQVGEGTFTR